MQGSRLEALEDDLDLGKGWEGPRRAFLSRRGDPQGCRHLKMPLPPGPAGRVAPPPGQETPGQPAVSGPGAPPAAGCGSCWQSGCHGVVEEAGRAPRWTPPFRK